MNIKEFLNLIKKYRWLIIAIPLLTLIITFFIVKNLPKEYKSEAKLSTGLLDPSRQVAPDMPSYQGPDVLIKLNQQFINIMDIMQMSKNMSVLSYRLMLHDLKNPQKPFKPLSDDIKNLTVGQRQEVINLIEERLNKRQVLTPLDNGNVKLYDLVGSMGYDEKTLSKKLNITHEQNSDFIAVEFISQNTLLSVFVVNTFSNDFIGNYILDQISNKNNSILVLDSLLKKKEAVMNERIAQLKDYKVRNGVLNLDKQSQIIYQQITDNENKKSQALIDKQAFQAALKNVNDNLNNRFNDRYLGAEVLTDNQAIVNLKNKVQAAENVYLDGGYKVSDKKKVDSLQSLLSSKLVKSNDNYVSDPLVAKQTLVQRRIAIGIDLDKTTAGIQDIDRELVKLNAKFTSMVPYDAGVQDLERNADVATKEYLEILSRYNQTNLDKNIGLRLQIAQDGVPSAPESSKKLLYIAISVVASLAICFCILFLIYAFDRSINDAKELHLATKSKIIGELNFIKPKNRDIEQIWKEASSDQQKLAFKNQIRSLRFEIANLLYINDKKVLGITSLHSAKPQIFANTSLTYALALLGKKILLIGDQEMANALSTFNVQTNQSLDNILQGTAIKEDKLITFLNSDMGEKSLLESRNSSTIKEVFERFKSQFDLVIISLASIDNIAELKEWVSFSDKYIGVFEAGSAINEEEKLKLLKLNEDSAFAGWVVNGVNP